MKVPAEVSRRPFVVALVLVAVASAAGCPARTPPLPPAPVVASAQDDELYELSPARVHVRRLAIQGIRLLAPHWSAVRKGDRRVLQATLVETLSEERIAPFMKVRLRRAVEARPDLAAEALRWLRSPVGYEVKFAEATAMRAEPAPDLAFYRQVSEVRQNLTPDVRDARIRRLAETTQALDRTLDVTTAVGTVVARLVNVARPGLDPLPEPELLRIVESERRNPEVIDAWEPVVLAALLVRCRDLDLAEIDDYVDFAGTDAGAWYHESMASALIGAVADAAMDVEGVFDANAHSDGAVQVRGGFDLDALVVSLPSGRDVRLLNLAQIGPPPEASVLLRYESSLALGDAASVRREAAEVWEHVRAHIESGGATHAVLQATGSVDGWVFPVASSRRYAWRRQQGGAWSVAASDAPGQLERDILWSLPP